MGYLPEMWRDFGVAVAGLVRTATIDESDINMISR